MNELTVVIPTFNRLSRLRRTLPAILENTRASIHIMISDNCSTDGTSEYLACIAAKHHRVSWTRHTSNLGAVGNLVTCLRSTTTSFAMVVSDDDFIVGPYISLVADAIHRFQDVAVVKGDVGSRTSRAAPSLRVYGPGPRAAAKAFGASGSISGLTLNVAYLSKILGGEIYTHRTLYPQVDWAVKLALVGAFVEVSGAGFVTGWQVSVMDTKREQGRPYDMGVRERVEIAQQLPNRFFRAYELNALALWSRSVIEEVREELDSEAEIIAQEIYLSLAPHSVVNVRSRVLQLPSLSRTTLYNHWCSLAALLFLGTSKWFRRGQRLLRRAMRVAIARSGE